MGIAALNPSYGQNVGMLPSFFGVDDIQQASFPRSAAVFRHRPGAETIFPGEETILGVRRSGPERIRSQIGATDQQRSSIMWAIIASSGIDRAQNTSAPEGSAEVWRQAEQRRADDIGTWLGQVLQRRRRLKAANASKTYPNGNPALR